MHVICVVYTNVFFRFGRRAQHNAPIGNKTKTAMTTMRRGENVILFCDGIIINTHSFKTVRAFTALVRLRECVFPSFLIRRRTDEEMRLTTQLFSR